MVIVAYEVADYRDMKRNKASKIPPKIKWINLDQEPSAYDILCYMTCFAALFTGRFDNNLRFRYITPLTLFMKPRCKPVKRKKY